MVLISASTTVMVRVCSAVFPKPSDTSTEMTVSPTSELVGVPVRTPAPVSANHSGNRMAAAKVSASPVLSVATKFHSNVSPSNTIVDVPEVNTGTEFTLLTMA